MNKYISMFLLVFSTWHTEHVYAMYNNTQAHVYFHGYGEPVLDHELDYKVKFQEDATQEGLFPDITKSSFYTKANVITGIQFLKKKAVEEKTTVIHVTARSNGGGVFINCLYFLHHYDDHKAYFKDTDITKEDAEAIINAINNGSIIITVPLLSLSNALLLVRLKTIGGYSTAALCTYYGYKKYGYRFNVIWLLPIFYILSQGSGASSETISEEIIIPKVTHYSYDPNHIKPIEAIPFLSNKIKCPTFLHVCENDGVLKGPNQDTVTLFENLRKGNEHQTFIALTDDDSHNKNGKQFLHIQSSFENFVINKIERHKEKVRNTGVIDNVDSLKHKIGWPVIGLLEFSYQNPTIV